MNPEARTPTDYALHLGALGCAVFRIKAGTKDFYIDKRWAHEPIAGAFDIYDAFTRPDGSCAGYNYGVNAGASDLLILDIDIKGAVDGLANLATLGGIPPTFTVRTPSGGLHYYFKANGQKFGQADLAPGVQVRSFHGYVIGPGSRTKEIRRADGSYEQYAGVYKIENDAPFADLPQWIVDKAAPLGERPTKPGAALFEPDSIPQALEAAVAHVKSLPVAGDGERNIALCNAARDCLDFGCSPEKACEILIEHFNAHPAVPAEEIEDICGRILTHYVGPIGKEYAGFGFEPVNPETLKAADGVLAAKFALRVTRPRISEFDESAAPLRPWLIKGRLLSGKVTELVAPGSVGKSLLTMQWAAALALGSDVAARVGCEITKTCKTLVLNNEDETDELERRMNAICRYFKLDRAGVADNVQFASGAENPLVIVERNEKGRPKIADAVAELIAYVKQNGIGAVIIDPLVDFHMAEENSNAEMAHVMRVWRHIASVTGAAVLIVHHTRKPGADGAAGNADAGRGASAVINAARAASTLFTMTEKDATAFGVSPDRRHRYVRLDDCKANLTLASPFAQWFQRITVKLSNGEDVGVLEPCKLDPAEKADALAMATVLAPELILQGSMSVAAAARFLAADDAYSGIPAPALAKRIAKAFVSGESIETNSGTVHFEAKGKEGGDFSIENNRGSAISH